MVKKITDDQPRVHFDCTKCPAYCCSIYERVAVTKRDIARLARHFNVTPEVAARRYTKLHRSSGDRILRRMADDLFGEACIFLDRETRGCGAYHGRPNVCREYPDRTRCAYYDVLRFERKQQRDDNVLPLFQITFREDTAKEAVETDKGTERVWEWTPKKMRKARGEN